MSQVDNAQMAPPNLFGGGFGLAMPQTGGIPNMQAGLAGQPLIMQPQRLEAPPIVGFGEMGNGDYDQMGMQQMSYGGVDAFQGQFVFYPETGLDEPEQNQSTEPETSCDAPTQENSQEVVETAIKTREAGVKKKTKAGGMCC